MFDFFKKQLPHCDTLFEKFFSPWYPDEDRPTITRPDMFIIHAFNGQRLNLEEIQYLPNTLLESNKKQIQVMTHAALNDYQQIMKCDKIDLNVLNAVDEFYDRKKIYQLIRESDPADFSNNYLIAVCEFAVTLGFLFNQFPGYGWLYSHPYFHSIIVHKNTGFGITVFDWAVKKFSEYGVDDGDLAKFHAAIKEIKT